jgi:hypothetical protein
MVISFFVDSTIRILVFARRCAPGCGYTMPMLKEAIGNAIRCARYKLKRSHAHLIVAAAMGDKNGSGGNDKMAQLLSQDDETF